jgi:Carboxypeptidase regulatory-like domain
MKLWKCLCRTIFICALPFCATLSAAQAGSTLPASGSLKGKVADPSGAMIPQATITATSASGKKSTVQTNEQGQYEIKGLAPGNYTVAASANGFTTDTEQNVPVVAGQTERFDFALAVAAQEEKVQVEAEGATVGVNPAENASAIIIKGQDLEALSDDPDELQSELEALAGPSAGPNGGQIYIDGFTGGQIPPKASIREIRINQNPFSAEYDTLGYGRIEIFTKPGTNQFHGQFLADGNDSAFNSIWSPVEVAQPPYHSELFNGSLSGPISKNASFFVDGQRRDIADVSIIDATVLNSAFAEVPLNQAISSPETRTNISPRVDLQLSKNNTLMARYQFTRNTESNQGVSEFAIYPDQAYNLDDTEQTLQLSDTQVISSNVINETRFQFIRDNNNESPLVAPTLTTAVLGAFTNGGDNVGEVLDDENHYELQNYTSIVHGKHFIKFGGRLRATTDSNHSQTDFNGMYTFASLAAYRNSVTKAPCAPGSLECGPSQFSIASGPAEFNANLVDAGLYAEDDWRIRPNLTLSYGLRFETQNHLSDHADFAPRMTVSWGLGGSKKTQPKTVVRAGFGMFYTRFTYDLLLQTERLNPNGAGQTQYVVDNPDFYPNIPTPSQLAVLPEISPTYYQSSPSLRAPYTIQSAASVERQLTKNATMAITYLNSIGDHLFFIRNVNAPLPGTYDPASSASAVRPLSSVYGNDNLFQYDSEGVYRQNELIANFRVSAGPKLSLFGFYTLNYANSNLGAGSPINSNTSVTGGFTSGGSLSTPEFLSNPYDPMADYGRAAFDTHDRGLLGGSFLFPYYFRLSPFLIVNSGSPYNITVGQDIYGFDTFNERPAFVSSAACSTRSVSATNTVCTPLGTFNDAPRLGQPVLPINSGTGPAEFSLSLRLSKTFGFGPETGAAALTNGPHGGGGHGGLGGRGLTGGGGGGGGPFSAVTTSHRYNVTFSISARNAVNRVNLATPVADVDSTLVGKYNSLAGGPFSFSGNATRRIDLQALFTF